MCIRDRAYTCFTLALARHERMSQRMKVPESLYVVSGRGCRKVACDARPTARIEDPQHTPLPRKHCRL
eukprot:812267-Alexandrium_andersonii.AAC.1